MDHYANATTDSPAIISADRASLRRTVGMHAGRAGLLATLIMLATQLIWRLNWSTDGVVQAFPEFVVAAISRLTPLSVFGSATENYGSAAKKTLFAVVILGIVAIGFRGGQIAGALAKRLGGGFLGRVVAGTIVAAGLLAVTGFVILPIAHLGVFATNSSHTGEILTQLIVTFALYGLAWAALATPRAATVSDGAVEGENGVTRRQALGQLAWAGGTIAAAVAVAVSSWRLISPRAGTTATANAPLDGATGGSPLTAPDIVATQRAVQGHPLPPTPTPTQTPAAAVEQVQDVAELRSDVIAQDATAGATDPFALFTQLEGEGHLTPVLTETKDFYHVSKNLSDPSVNSKDWTLKIGGLVATPLELTYDQLMARATTQKITTLCCISNTLNGDLISTGLWTGVPLADLLNEAGVKPEAVDLKLHAADDYEDSFPVARGMDPDTMVVIGLNGEPLTDDHGFPTRLIVPGIYGMKNVKWLQSIELVDKDFKGYWESRGWSDTAVNQVWARIDYPGDGDKVAPGPVIAAGMASAGDRDISRVEISLDDGDTWADATIEPSLNPPFTWVRWAFPFDAVADTSYVMRVRATDGAGAVAIEQEQDPLPDGATGWPRRRFKPKS